MANGFNRSSYDGDQITSARTDLAKFISVMRDPGHLALVVPRASNPLWDMTNIWMLRNILM